MSSGLLLLVVLTIFGSLASESLFTIWMLMEVNMLSFLGVCGCMGDFSKSLFKYFFIQSMASSVFLGSGVVLSWTHSELFVLVAVGSVLIKLGAAPLHLWLVSFMRGLKWKTFFLASTLQKVIPLYVLSSMGVFLGGVITLSAMVGVVGAAWHSGLKNLMVYSSVFNMGWLVGSGPDMGILLFYLSIYGLGLSMVVLALDQLNAETLSEKSVNYLNNDTKAMISAGLLSMGGVPPLVGFLGKVIILSGPLMIYGVQEALILLISSIFMLYLYSRILLDLFFSASSSSLLSGPGASGAGVGVSLFLVLSGAALLFLCMGVSHKSVWSSSTF